MERRDYLMAQIEEMGRAMGRIIAGFLGLKKQGDPSRAIDISNEQFTNELDLDIEFILHADKESLTDYFHDRMLVDRHVESLSDYFRAVGHSILERGQANYRVWITQARVLLDIADEISRTASFSRLAKKDELDELINQQHQ